jgi:hypothetical protein
MQIKEKAVDRCKRSTAQNQTLSYDSRWHNHSNQIVCRDQGPTRFERRLKR